MPPDAFGSPDDDVDQDGIWHQNEPALRAFLAVATQWRYSGGGMGPLFAIGLDYGAARAGLRMAGIKVTPELWSDVQVIEAAATAAMNRKSN